MRKEPPRATRAKKSSSSGKAKVKPTLGHGDEGAELPTELCIGSDGVIYVNAEGIDPERIKDRKMFHGFAMTEQEMEVAVDEIHRLAFNVTVSVQEEMRKRRLRRKKQQSRRGTRAK